MTLRLVYPACRWRMFSRAVAQGFPPEASESDTSDGRHSRLRPRGDVSWCRGEVARGYWPGMTRETRPRERRPTMLWRTVTRGDRQRQWSREDICSLHQTIFTKSYPNRSRIKGGRERAALAQFSAHSVRLRRAALLADLAGHQTPKDTALHPALDPLDGDLAPGVRTFAQARNYASLRIGIHR